jgi:hypothetical protein
LRSIVAEPRWTTEVAPHADDALRTLEAARERARTAFASVRTVVTSQLILAMFLVAQAYDGLFTYVAVQAYGVMAEGNVLLATWIQLVGAGPAIVGAKLLSASCGVVLYVLGVRRALLALTVFYGACAIAPWLVVLHHV